MNLAVKSAMLVVLARQRALCPSLEPEFGLCFEGRLSHELDTAGVVVHRLPFREMNL